MNEERDLSNQMRAITISREYGSGGGEIASRLARRLGWQLVDHAIVQRVASELGTSQEEAETHDESTGGIISQVLNVMQNLYPAYMVSAPPEAFLSAEDYSRTVDRIVKAAAARGHVVIVGRASQVILADVGDVLNVRVIAPFEKRVVYVMQREGVDRHPDDAQLYDLVLNTSLLDLESAVDIICFTLQQKAKGLATKTSELGPATGLARYPAQPEDFRSLAWECQRSERTPAPARCS